MRTLYIDCTNGISSDMFFNALRDLGAEESAIKQALSKLNFKHNDHSRQQQGHAMGHRGYREIQDLIEEAPLALKVKQTALNIYEVIARAEAKVHSASMDSVHFHEVGRKDAVKNIVGIAAAIENLHIDRIFCSEIHDGQGFIECSHGKIPVPVPAVVAMKSQCDYIFVTDRIETEMVTPSGLGILIGIKAQCAADMPAGRILSTGHAKGSRDMGRAQGLTLILLDEL